MGHHHIPHQWSHYPPPLRRAGRYDGYHGSHVSWPHSSIRTTWILRSFSNSKQNALGTESNKTEFLEIFDGGQHEGRINGHQNALFADTRAITSCRGVHARVAAQSETHMDYLLNGISTQTNGARVCRSPSRQNSGLNVICEQSDKCSDFSTVRFRSMNDAGIFVFMGG